MAIRSLTIASRLPGTQPKVALATAALGDVEGDAAPEHAARTRTRIARSAGTVRRGAARVAEVNHGNTKNLQRNGLRRGRDESQKPLASTRIEGGANRSVARVLPTFLSKVRACTVWSATGLALSWERSP